MEGSDVGENLIFGFLTAEKSPKFFFLFVLEIAWKTDKKQLGMIFTYMFHINQKVLIKHHVK